MFLEWGELPSFSGKHPEKTTVNFEALLFFGGYLKVKIMGS